MFASHHWPRWGNARIQEVLRGQRDLYAHMNNQVLHFANQGVTINEIHNVYELLQSILARWDCGATTVPLNTTAAVSSSASSDFRTAIRRPSFRSPPPTPPRSMSR
jgi:alkyl sulfatase BDS1-like metallo-beta-lactamase superfamily hydrolase